MTDDILNFPSFTIRLESFCQPEKMPLIQSGAWAIWNKKLIILGGRIEGFHGLNQLQNVFGQNKVNKSIWAVDLETFDSQELKLDPESKKWEQLFSSNMQFEQDENTLYIVGGYGAKSSKDKRSDDTFDSLIAFDLDKLLVAIDQNSDPSKAVLINTCDPHLKVTGGELLKIDDLFYLSFGQCFDGVYDPGKTGLYTGAIRTFRIKKNKIELVQEIKDSQLHRRDLNVVKIHQAKKTILAGLGGVFDKNGNGYSHPVYLDPTGKSPSIQVDDLKQVTNHYNCGKASIYDSASDTCITVLMGGIGQNQFHQETNTWENGDRGAKIPFVKSITQLIYSKGKMYQHIQTPPSEPEMPDFLGANAIFIPDPKWVSQNFFIDYGKLTEKETIIGLFYGGIQSQRPTSSTIYPTKVNDQIYRVILEKNESQYFSQLTKIQTP